MTARKGQQPSQHQALVVDDDEDMRRQVSAGLTEEGITATEAANGQEAREAAAQGQASVMVIDRRLPDVDGLRLLREFRYDGISTPALIVTGHPTLDSAVEALGLDAADYLVKPVNPRHVAAMARGLINAPTLSSCDYLWESLRARHDFDHCFSADPMVQRCYCAAARVCSSDAPVVIEGETGVGKEYLAKAIHLMGRRAGKPFLAINCGAVPETLLESELFGHEKGAFTSAAARKRGLAEEADEGSLFLDEIGEMSPTMQVKLLRFLEEGSFRRLGGTELVTVDVRLICATNKELLAEVAAGRFRADLYYRLAVIPLYLPPLRQRPTDIELYAGHFCESDGEGATRLSPQAIERLKAYPWPGNLRELRNVIRRAVLLRSGEIIAPDDLRFEAIGRAV